MLRGVADTKRVLQGAACRQPREHRGTTIAEVTRTALEEHIGAGPSLGDSPRRQRDPRGGVAITQSG